ncbi:MAG: hypothetical protein IJ165_07820 [Proteobacteria bacterium]|nr:hypothetical protein [Pseudomonadota bacterium]
MKNRKSLVFALCAMLGAAGLTACGDDGGNSPQDEHKTGKLIVGPAEMQIESGEEGEIQASYLENKKLNVSTDSKDCVSVVAEEVNTGSTGKTTIKVMALGSGCDASITVSVDDQREKVVVKVIDNSAPKLTVKPATIDLGAGDQASAFATYKSASGSVIADATLSLLSSNENCVKVDSSVKTDAEGDAEIVLTAADDAGECMSFITVTPPQGASKNVTVTVAADKEPEISGTPVLTFTPDKIVEGYEEKAKSDFTVTFKDGSNKGINGQKITFAVDDSTCVKLSNTSKRTGADGTADNSILLLKPGCTANITAKATNAGKDYEAKLPVTINALSEYNIKLALKYENESRFSGVHFTAYKIAQDSCDKIFETYKGYDAYISDISPDGSEDSVSGNPSNSILNTFEIEDIDVEMDKSIVAWGAVDGFGDATAVGCIDVSSANAGQTVVVELEALPLSIVGTYDIIANFDLTSAFPPSGNALPPVENMAAGDWVKFTVDLFKEPVEVLLDFVWANTVSRLKAVSSDNNIVKGIIDFIVSDTTKQLAIKSLKPLIEKYLNAKEDGKQSWYQILKTISGDVEELVRNMQFNGNFKIEEVDANDKTQITKASEEFKNLEYQWNFVPEGGTKNCIQNAYAKAGSCRTSMNLGGKVDAIAGSWTGSVSEADGVDGKLKIGSHPLTFKWATILYSAVFGEILPRAMGYSDSKFVSKQGADGYRYITAFLNALVFQPVAKYYGQEKAGKAKDNGDGTYPSLSIEGADKDCQRFIESLVYLIYSDASSAAGVISVVADLACGNQALGQLDTLVEKSLSNIESSTENVINLSADGCSLYAEGQLQYQKMGKPDQEFYSAYEVVQSGKQSMRCDWQISLPDKISKNPIKGLFHGVRSDL